MTFLFDAVDRIFRLFLYRKDKQRIRSITNRLLCIGHESASIETSVLVVVFLQAKVLCLIGSVCFLDTNLGCQLKVTGVAVQLCERTKRYYCHGPELKDQFVG